MRRILCFLITAVCFWSVSNLGQAAAAQPVRINADVVYASNDHTGRSAELKGFASDLPYDSLELLEQRSFDLDFASSASVNIPGGGLLQIQPESYDGSMIRVKVWMEKASKYKLDMVLQIANGGTVVVAGPSYKNGTILIPISARMK